MQTYIVWLIDEMVPEVGEEYEVQGTGPRAALNDALEELATLYPDHVKVRGVADVFGAELIDFGPEGRAFSRLIEERDGTYSEEVSS